ncbi:MAG: peptide chain release factor N(5)-glutamine methyltransferase [Anaerolineae bacterium]|nr:peptide chain release factor N(5)-glutamine methyltransferase [Thermoflexales bacterium]MDW8406218.1 peptide chain release factor N(5)-glutamine methyltransferase [Anaerolineae bacterium]
MQTALRAAIARFEEAGIDSPTLTARVLLAVVLNRPREWLVAHPDQPIEPAQQAAFDHLVQRTLAREPLAYVLGRREFYGLDFTVDPRVLIPRPETEILVDLALAHLRRSILSTAQPQSEEHVVDVIDVGTGSGAIAVAIATCAPTARVIATDVSAEALDVARLNAARHGVAERIQFITADLLHDVPVRARVITANLPYVTTEEIDVLPAEIQAHEPRIALDGGPDGLSLVRRLLNQLPAHLLPGGAAFFEIGSAQGVAALRAAAEALPDAQAVLEKDWAGLDRVLSVFMPEGYPCHHPLSSRIPLL